MTKNGDLQAFTAALRKAIKHLSWNLLTQLSNQSDLPCLCGGDFNEILMES